MLQVAQRKEPAGTQPDVEIRHSAGVGASLLEYLHACPICGHTDLQHYCRVPSLFNAGEFIRYERCRECGTVLRNPRLPAAHRLDQYAERVFTTEQKRLNPKSQVHYWYMMQIISRLLAPGTGRRLLDFGCGAGGFLVEARAAGFDVMGLELNGDLARHVAAVHGMPVYQGTIDDPEFEPRFNVIVSSQVFEHLLDPRATLLQLRRHLIRPGLILIEVPNLRDIRERLRRGSTMNDSHLFYFSRRSLTRLLADCGFSIAIVHEGLRPYRFFADRARTLPVGGLRAAERLLSLCRVKTVLSVVGALA